MILPLLVACRLLLPVPASFLSWASDPQEVVGRARAALGWDALGPEQGVRVVGDARLMGTDSVQTILFDGRGRYVQEFDGPLGQSNGTDGHTPWIRDWTGTARVLVLGDLANAEVSALLVSGGWTRAGERLIFDSTSTDGDEVRLDFHHADGITRGTIHLDGATHLPRSATFGFDETSSRWTFAGWQSHDRLRFAERIELSQSGMTQGLTTRTVERLEQIADAAFAPRLEPPGDAHFDAGTPPEIEVKRAASGHLLVHPTLDGEDLGWFIFDSGAGTNCISTSVAEALPEGPFGQIGARGIGGTVPASFWRANQLRLGPITVERPAFIELDLGFLEAYFGVPVGGILGFELLARCVAELDVTRSTIALHDPGSYALPEGGRWEETLLYGRHPCVQAAFEAHEGVFKIDTGAAGDTVTMHYQAVHDLGLVEGRETTASQAGGVGGVISTRSGTLATFRLGGHVFAALPASFAVEDTGAFSDDYVLGNIGGKLLEPFVLVFDYPHGRLGFVPRD